MKLFQSEGNKVSLRPGSAKATPRQCNTWNMYSKTYTALRVERDMSFSLTWPSFGLLPCPAPYRMLSHPSSAPFHRVHELCTLHRYGLQLPAQSLGCNAGTYRLRRPHTVHRVPFPRIPSLKSYGRAQSTRSQYLSATCRVALAFGS